MDIRYRNEIFERKFVPIFSAFSLYLTRKFWCFIAVYMNRVISVQIELSETERTGK